MNITTETGKSFAKEMAKLQHDAADLEARIVEWEAMILCGHEPQGYDDDGESAREANHLRCILNRMTQDN